MGRRKRKDGKCIMCGEIRKITNTHIVQASVMKRAFDNKRPHIKGFYQKVIKLDDEGRGFGNVLSCDILCTECNKDVIKYYEKFDYSNFPVERLLKDKGKDKRKIEFMFIGNSKKELEIPTKDTLYYISYMDYFKTNILLFIYNKLFIDKDLGHVKKENEVDLGRIQGEQQLFTLKDFLRQYIGDRKEIYKNSSRNMKDISLKESGSQDVIKRHTAMVMDEKGKLTDRKWFYQVTHGDLTPNLKYVKRDKSKKIYSYRIDVNGFYSRSQDKSVDIQMWASKDKKVNIFQVYVHIPITENYDLKGVIEYPVRYEVVGENVGEFDYKYGITYEIAIK